MSWCHAVFGRGSGLAEGGDAQETEGRDNSRSLREGQCMLSIRVGNPVRLANLTGLRDRVGTDL